MGRIVLTPSGAVILALGWPSHDAPARALDSPDLGFQLDRLVSDGIGCVPDGDLADAAVSLLKRGEVAVGRDRGLACRVRLASFCGYGDEPPESARVVITLGHILRFMQEHLDACRALLQSAQFKDRTLSLLKLMEKLDITMQIPR